MFGYQISDLMMFNGQAYLGVLTDFFQSYYSWLYIYASAVLVSLLLSIKYPQIYKIFGLLLSLSWLLAAYFLYSYFSQIAWYAPFLSAACLWQFLLVLGCVIFCRPYGYWPWVPLMLFIVAMLPLENILLESVSLKLIVFGAVGALSTSLLTLVYLFTSRGGILLRVTALGTPTVLILHYLAMAKIFIF